MWSLSLSSCYVLVFRSAPDRCASKFGAAHSSPGKRPVGRSTSKGGAAGRSTRHQPESLKAEHEKHKAEMLERLRQRKFEAYHEQFAYSRGFGPRPAGSPEMSAMASSRESQGMDSCVEVPQIEQIVETGWRFQRVRQ